MAPFIIKILPPGFTLDKIAAVQEHGMKGQTADFSISYLLIDIPLLNSLLSQFVERF